MPSPTPWCSSYWKGTLLVALDYDRQLYLLYVKAKIDKTQQNSKCRLWEEKDEMVNHIVSECSKLAPKDYKARFDWVDKVIHWELWKRLNFDHTTKWYIHKPELVLENEIHKILWDFETKADC